MSPLRTKKRLIILFNRKYEKTCEFEHVTKIMDFSVILKVLGGYSLDSDTKTEYIKLGGIISFQIKPKLVNYVRLISKWSCFCIYNHLMTRLL